MSNPTQLDRVMPRSVTSPVMRNPIVGRLSDAGCYFGGMQNEDGRLRAGEIDEGPKPRSGVVQRQILIALLGLPRAGCARLDPNDEPSSACRGYPHSCSSRRIQAPTLCTAGTHHLQEPQDPTI
ncbi:hypothetical protein ACQR3V_27920 [Rhodococcus erythropolis]|uniref:hypothetical protein n=1 Tax=Rhodococcus erythropolis TaxID=1833 RepID=UPI002A636451|nr:hypothetical protein [Rhodococcus sp. APC 3903]